MTAWGACSLVQIVSTIQSFPNWGNRRRSEAGRFCGHSWRLFLSYRSLPTITAARVDFWPSVSVSKNSVPGGTVSSDTRPFDDLEVRNPERQKTPFPAGSQLLWVQSERLELPAPFCRSITKSFDSDAAEQSAFDRRSDEIRGEEGK
jgi:hypothetical protein